MFLLLVYSPSDHNIQGWVRTKPNTRNSIQVSHVDAGAQNLKPSSATFLGALAGTMGKMLLRAPHVLAECLGLNPCFTLIHPGSQQMMGLCA